MQERHNVREISARRTGGRLKVQLAETDRDILECLSLRYDIFSREMGATVGDGKTEIDRDRFDDYCSHLMVIDTESSELVATTRLLTNREAEKVGHFYSETEFDLSRVLQQPGVFMEVGRTCIHPGFRNGAALAMLWHGIGRQVAERKIEDRSTTMDLSKLKTGVYFVHFRDKNGKLGSKRVVKIH